jgi:hypothetical protein
LLRVLSFRQRRQKGGDDYSAMLAGTAFSSSEDVFNDDAEVGAAR